MVLDADNGDEAALHRAVYSGNMSGLRFESMADMPPRMRELYARQALPEDQAKQRTKEYLRNKKMMRSKYGIDIQEV